MDECEMPTTAFYTRPGEESELKQHGRVSRAEKNSTLKQNTIAWPIWR